MAEHCYTITLNKVSPGRPFLMVNYKGAYICLSTDKSLEKDGYQLIVDLATGRAFYMANEKPCFLYPGEAP